ncbi:MAG: hypothetical protein EZS28_022340, partial [Streblomastix strix]
KPPQDFPIAIHNVEPADIDLTDINGVMKKISKKQTKYNTVSLTQVIENGIWAIESEFYCSQYDGYGAIGITPDSFNIPAGQYPGVQQSWGTSTVYCRNGTGISGNTAFRNNQIVRLEVDSEKGTLILFVQGVQQPVYISGIREKVRFIICMYHAGSTCNIRSLKKISAPTSGNVANEKPIQW